MQNQTEAEKKIEEIIRKHSITTDKTYFDPKSMLLEAMKWAVERVMPEEKSLQGIIGAFESYVLSERQKRKGFNQCRDHIINTSRELGL